MYPARCGTIFRWNQIMMQLVSSADYSINESTLWPKGGNTGATFVCGFSTPPEKDASILHERANHRLSTAFSTLRRLKCNCASAPQETNETKQPPQGIYRFLCTAALYSGIQWSTAPPSSLPSSQLRCSSSHQHPALNK